MFAGWPANYGAWAFGDEVVVTFVVGTLRVSGDEALHARDRSKPFVPCQVRSTDGGSTWTREQFAGPLPGSASLSADEHVDAPLTAARGMAEGVGAEFVPLEQPIDFTDPETAVLCGRTGLLAGSRSWFYVSRDRCRSWSGPHELPSFGRAGIAARTDIVALSAHEALWLLSAADDVGGEGGTICASTTDGGRTFELRSEVASGREEYAIMPSTVLMADGALVSIIRRKDHLAARRSDDEGRSWTEVCELVASTGPFGNPGSLVLLDDGVLAVAYGRRSQPHAMCVRASHDAGSTWGDEVALVEVAGSADFGYPRTAALGPGRFLTVYYSNDADDSERYIAGVIWEGDDVVRTTASSIQVKVAR